MATWKKTTKTSLTAALMAYQACRSLGLQLPTEGAKMTALEVAGRVLLMYTNLDQGARYHHEHLTWARTEVIRAGIMTGIITLEAAAKAD